VVAITLGTGLGGSFIIDCEVQKSGKGVPPDGYLYKLPYQQGIAEDYISSRWLINTFNAETESKLTEVKEINDLASTGNMFAQRLFDKMGIALGEVLAPWLDAFEADSLVIGGNVRKAHLFLVPSLKRTLNENNVKASICISTKGEKSAIAGAAYLCKQHYAPRTADIK
jgi:glucokinase